MFTGCGELIWRSWPLEEKTKGVIVRLRRGPYHKRRGIVMTSERIVIDPAFMMGKPVIRGTRITVELILRKLAEGAPKPSCGKITRS